MHTWQSDEFSDWLCGAVIAKGLLLTFSIYTFPLAQNEAKACATFLYVSYAINPIVRR